jgi:hypothetical protein
MPGSGDYVSLYLNYLLPIGRLSLGDNPLGIAVQSWRASQLLESSFETYKEGVPYAPIPMGPGRSRPSVRSTTHSLPGISSLRSFISANVCKLSYSSGPFFDEKGCREPTSRHKGREGTRKRVFGNAGNWKEIILVSIP